MTNKKMIIIFFKFIIILVIMFFVVRYIFNSFYTKKIAHINSTNYSINNCSITGSSESDTDVIGLQFMNGMSVSDYNSVCLKNTNYIKSNGKYVFNNYDFETMLHYNDLESLFINMNNSSIANVEIIGKSTDNRNIYGIEVGHGNNVIYIDANIHAAEVGNTLILTRFLSELINNYEKNDKYTIELLKNVKIASIPCLNPDGYEVYNYGIESINNKELWIYKNKEFIDFENIKSNANGIDLNRNFPTQNAGIVYKNNKLIKNTSLEPTFENGKYYNGNTLGSENETRASMYFMLKHYKNTIAYINMHTQGRVIYSGKPNLSNDFNNLTISFGNKVSSLTGYKLHGLSAEEVGEGNDGSATDFMAELANGLIFSSKTGRLSTDKYIGNSTVLEYSYPVITLETTKTWTRNPSVFKDEYYNHGIRDMLYSIIEN